MKPTVPLMMFGWVPFVLKLFQVLSHRRAVITSLILAWMFLPQYSYGLPGLPDWDKTAVASISVLLATLIFAQSRFEKFQFDIQDGLVLFWCLTPMFASLENGLGAYDGVAASKNYVTTWFIPYLVGRLYLTDWESIKDLAWGVFLGGVIYIPLCWTEIVLSPQLHMWVYGWHPHDFIQSIRGNSYRPVIFMHHGLMVGMWMAAATLCGIGLWRLKMLEEIKPLWDRFKVPYWIRPSWVPLFLLFTFVCCQSLGAFALFLQAMVVLFLSFRFKSVLPLLLLIAFPVCQMGMKVIKKGEYSSNSVDMIAKFSEDRAASLEFRLINEKILVEKALEKPVFGWGGWGRSRVRDHTGEDISVTDAYWVIILGTTGLVGLTAFVFVTLLPPLRILLQFKKHMWENKTAVLLLPLLILLPLYFQDCLLNDMKNPIYMVIAGGIISIVGVPALFRKGQERTPESEGSELSSIPIFATRYI